MVHETGEDDGTEERKEEKKRRILCIPASFHSYGVYFELLLCNFYVSCFISSSTGEDHRNFPIVIAFLRGRALDDILSFL